MNALVFRDDQYLSMFTFVVNKLKNFHTDLNWPVEQQNYKNSFSRTDCVAFFQTDLI
jgi:hypothetical protein